jgi:Superfamily I DNA and RNA helicases and helicase subunits
MEEDNNITGNYNGKITLEYLPCINYAMIHNHITAFRFCDIVNTDNFDWQQVKVTIEGEYLKKSQSVLEIIKSNQCIRVDDLELFIDGNKLINLTEGIDTIFYLTLNVGEVEIYKQEYSINLMAFDQWSGSSVLPELLASFVTPNNPILSRVSVNASKFLEQWTGSSSLDEYQTQDPNRVRSQVAAIYEALRSESLVYCTPPASFERYGQRVRLVDKVLNEKLGTCMDLTLLFASCLESNGIHPLLVLLKGHIFVGAWLSPNIFPQVISDDASFLLKSCADGINDIVVVESTALTSSKNLSFEDAVNLAETELKAEDKFELFIDVYHCRLDNIRPLPQRINKDGVLQVIENTGIEHENATTSVNQLNHFNINCICNQQQEISKQIIWERKLLDFSLRNNLININARRRVIPFISFNIDHLEDNLQEGVNYQISHTIVKGKLEPNQCGIYDSSILKRDLEDVVTNELKNKRIHSYMTDSELQNALKYIYRTSRTALEENGANSLFLVLGILKWFETDKSQKPRYAPILLLPVDIIRRGGVNGYVIRTRDEDIILNITLVEFLKQQFNVVLTGLNPLPTDDSGVDVKLIFSIIRTCIRELKGWDVLEESMLGIFSFNKFVMWNDIHNNADKLSENDIIYSLMNNKIQWTDNMPNVDARQIDKETKPCDFAIPVDVDSSQMEAVIEAGEGKSFVLHGPPGTGKSQTITNMIANALYKGKRVLFVAEKMAALSVVQNRLSRIGLSPFCLEMHSNKATKTHFLEQLQQAINVIHIKTPEDYDKLSNELFEHRKKLIDYIEALHKRHPSGYSLYECITNYLNIEGDEITVENSIIENINRDTLNQFIDSINSLDVVFKITGHPQEHELRGLYPKDISLNSIEALKVALSNLQNTINEINDQRRFFFEKLAINISDDFDGYRLMKSFSEILLRLKVLNGDLLHIAGNSDLMQVWKNIIDCGKERDSIKYELLQDFKSDVLDLNHSDLKEQWQMIETKWFIPKFFSKHSFLKRIRLYNSSFVEEQIDELFRKLDTFHQKDKIINAHKQEFLDIYCICGNLDSVKWEDIILALDSALQLYQLIVQYAHKNNLLLSEFIAEFVKKIGADWNIFKQSYGAIINQTVSSVNKLNELKDEIDVLCDVNIPNDHIGEKLPLILNSWLTNYDKIKDWFQWCVRKKELESQNMNAVVSYIQNEHKTGKETANAFLKGVSHKLAIKIVDENELLRLFNGLLFEEFINKYRQLTFDFQELTKKELYARLAGRVPSLTMEAAYNSEVGILKRNITNGGRGTSIRRIIDQIPTLLNKLCPCMLMSPISVAQYIDLNSDKFDLVIFDEASQMPTSEAVGAIARGKSLIVVGDPKQMPPTSFFSSSQVDEDEAEFDDMESILDDCISLAMPSKYLTWHYRSKHESLIAFSNMNYYDGKLFTFPSVDNRTSKVKLIYVNGIYDKGRTRSNHVEAEAIIKEIIRRLKDPILSDKSIGVISFSQVQQNLIEDLLMEELTKYPELEQKVFQRDEPIFIKNLENVQGDERDVILFSVGYGPDKNGNISMNFGPLNNKGGERRLNVAVSRARYEMIVYSTLHSDQIDLKRTKSIGVEGLKKFLEFAEKGVMRTYKSKENILHYSLISLIAREIEKKGYKVDLFVGRSNFKIDIAVIDQKCTDRYIMGILCDGENYYETKTTRDREIVQPNILSMLNWNIIRVWSVDWYENKDKVINRIVDKLCELENVNDIQEKTSIFKKAKLFSIAETPVEVLDNDREKKYVFANINTDSNASVDIDTVMSSYESLRSQLEEIISVEQPITNTLLYKRIGQIWNIARVTSRLQKKIDSLLNDFYVDPLSLSDNIKIYWQNADNANMYKYYRINSKRDILDIPIVEVMNVALYVIEQQLSLPINDLKKITSQLLGFNRMGNNLDNVITKAIDILIQKGLVLNNNEVVSNGRP